MAITEKEGRKFIQLAFTAASGDTWEMSQERFIRSMKLTGLPTKLVKDTDYVEVYEVGGDDPSIFILSTEIMDVFFNGKQFTKFGIKKYQLTNPTEVVLALEVD